MAQIETWYNQDLQQPVRVHYLDGSLFSHNSNGNRIGVHVFNNGEPVTLTGTVSGYVVTADGSTVPCTGTRSGNSASILIPAAAYQPGAVFITLFITDGTTVTTLASVSTNVLTARTNNQIDPGSVVTDWTQTINTAMQSVETAAENLGGIIAVPYANITYPVPLGKYTYYEGNLYRCISPIATSESFTAAHWTQVRLGDDVSNLKSAIDDLNTEINSTYYINYTEGKNLTANSQTHSIIDDANACVSDVIEISFNWESADKNIFKYTDSTSDANSYFIFFYDQNMNFLGYRGKESGTLQRAVFGYDGTKYVQFSFKSGITGQIKSNTTPNVIYWESGQVAGVLKKIKETEAVCKTYTDTEIDDAVDNLTEDWEYVEPKNWFVESEITTGHWLKPDGTEGNNANYCYTGKINVKPGDIVRVKTRDNTSQYHVTDNAKMNYLCAFDVNDNPVSAKGFDTATEFYTVPDGIYSIVISKYTNTMANGLGMVLINNSDELEYTPYFVPYWRAKEKFSPESYDAVKSASVGSEPTQAHLASMGNGDSFECGKTTARKNKIINFRALITTMGQFTIWNANSNKYFDSKVVIDATDVTVYSATTTDGYVQTYTAAHGLTFADYVNVEIELDDGGASKLTINTNGGTYSHENIGFNGRETVKASSEGAVFTDAYLSWVAKDIKKPLWVFGDSYTQLSSNDYWTKHVIEKGFDGFLLCGFPGAKSEPLYPEWRNMLLHGRPKYAFWAMGMNDADNSDSVNSSWKLYFDLFLEDCAQNGITPILATIPNTPTIRHTYKNAIVKASGKRYVDFAQAVGAESEGSGWFTGMLKSDQVHPTEQGAICLATQVLAQMPEIMQ